MSVFAGVVVSAAAGFAAGVALMRTRRGKGVSGASGITQLDAHLAATLPTPASGTAAVMRRDVQHVFESKEASHDIELLNRVLRDVRDLTGADEAIFWRWVESRQTLVPNAWSTEGAVRPEYFDVRAWGSIVRSSAEDAELKLTGDAGGAPTLAAAPVLSAGSAIGVLSLSAATGISFDREAASVWLPRFAAQMAGLVQLFELRRDYGRQMRQGDALLDAVRRMHSHKTAESLAQALCDMARDVTSATVAGLVRWNSADQHGVVQATSPAIDVEIGFHVTAESLVGQTCASRLPLALENATSATQQNCPYGGLAREIGSVAIVPILSADSPIGALVIEGRRIGEVSPHDARNLSLLAALARGPLEIVWEIEEVTRRARTDALTGLANRRHFDEQLRRVVVETDRFGGSCSLLLADLDRFKRVNDEHGHDAGDAVLRHVAQLFSDGVRAVDLCARYGGEEMAILLPQTSREGALELAERLRQAMEKRPILHNGVELPITASFGVATYPAPVPYGDWLMLAADKALYQAKADGRNCVRFIAANQVTPALYKMQ